MTQHNRPFRHLLGFLLVFVLPSVPSSAQAGQSGKAGDKAAAELRTAVQLLGISFGFGERYDS